VANINLIMVLETTIHIPTQSDYWQPFRIQHISHIRLVSTARSCITSTKIKQSF